MNNLLKEALSALETHAVTKEVVGRYANARWINRCAICGRRLDRRPGHKPECLVVRLRNEALDEQNDKA